MGCYVPNTHHEGKKIAGKLTTAMRKGEKSLEKDQQSYSGLAN